jgi:hypothetical protein
MSDLRLTMGLDGDIGLTLNIHPENLDLCAAAVWHIQVRSAFD